MTAITPRNRPSIAAALVAIGVLAFAACGGSPSDESAGANSSDDVPESPDSPDSEEPADGAGNADPPATAGDTAGADAAEPSSDGEPVSAADQGDSIVCWTTSPAGGDAIAWDRATEEAGLVEPLTGMHGHATAAGDVDGDGWTDLFVGGFADREPDAYALRGADGPSPDRLLLGGPDGFAVDTGFEGELARTSGATFADLDADGDLDLVVVRNPRHDGDISSRPTTIYENQGDENQGDENQGDENDQGSWRVASTIESSARGRAAAVFDIDRDGLPDLVLAADRFGDGPSRLYRNEGGFAFSDATDEWGMPDDMFTLALAAVDLNGDGWTDVVVSGDERVLLGGPDGFTVSVQDALPWELHGDEDDPAGIATGDLDGDGRPDLVVGHHFNSTVDAGIEVPIRVFLNRTDGDTLRLEEVTAEAGIPGLWTKSPHVAVVDVDNDGLADVVTSAAAADDTPFVLRNTGVDGSIPRFEPIGEPGSGQYWVTGAVDDFDRDGRADVFLVEWEPALESPLFLAAGGSGHHVRLDVSSLGIDAPATRVEALDGDGSPLATVWIESSTGYAAGAPAIAHLGLGDLDDDAVRLVVSPVALDPIEVTVAVDSGSRLGGC